MSNMPTTAITMTVRAGKMPSERLGSLLANAQEELYRLYHIARHARCEVVVCDAGGEARHRRGAGWQVLNANGGTAQANVVTVDFGSALRTPQPSITDTAAPIFDADGTFAGVLDIRPSDRNEPPRSDALTRAIVQATACAIEERAFRMRHLRDWIVAVSPRDDMPQPILFAVDRGQAIIAADRHGCALLTDKTGECAIGAKGISLWDLFEKNPAILRQKDHGDVPALLEPAGTSDAWPALLTPPEPECPSWQNWDRNVHTRPRLGLVPASPQSTPRPQARGGLPPAVLRRVCEHIDANLESRVELADLAAIANLSRCHFAHAFKQSIGATPHRFVMSRRLTRAHELLGETHLPIVEVALATGFADQSHFSRCFREFFHISPSEFRHSRR
jgi:AraC-like DNA-binding protein